jgi:hypothetical protein
MTPSSVRVVLVAGEAGTSARLFAGLQRHLTQVSLDRRDETIVIRATSASPLLYQAVTDTLYRIDPAWRLSAVLHEESNLDDR